MKFYLIIVAKNPCTETTCQNGGTCYADILWNAQCFCKEGFNGKFCEIDQRPTDTTKSTTKTTSSSKLLFLIVRYRYLTGRTKKLQKKFTIDDS